ncbi:2-amino-4-hydroxy-6-hydroxymethyldihydropteridine diphosphokinase [Candidatus Peribacteria bacterium RIFOXYC2_FULL_58_10]|nr:MAG: 2-amino-4-hydroxy-6-hydroxymethyldihydropteridine diphosphokinase [Candidatus Peribacteria bacterium RIFOXYC2_FULL_58_10]OGJ85287.1 MAG: 2-amino-4-hydroxy-6-hydroxymethyldihydropteridine diphosphokinase [Candidatus Peribacteria bacterium RIFOXYD2_FULL_58_15]
MALVFIGIGSNIDPETNLARAAKLLRKHWPAVRFSHVFRTAPQENTDQPDFRNAVASIETNGPPEEIQQLLRSIEHALAKSVTDRFGPRTIDLDLLLYGDQHFTERKGQDSGLVIPHPRMHRRRFVLEPLSELLDPETLHPILEKSWNTLKEQTTDQRCERTDIAL